MLLNLEQYRRCMEGPWLTPKDDAFDSRAYSAARTFCLNGQRVLFGWVPTKENCDDTKNFEWGGTFLPHEICQRDDGSLGVKIPDTIWNSFSSPVFLENLFIDSSVKRKEVILYQECGTTYRLEANVKIAAGVRSASGFMRTKILASLVSILFQSRKIKWCLRGILICHGLLV